MPRRADPEYNLAVCRPEIAKEWDYERNGELKPEDVAPGSHKKVYWIKECVEGEDTHIWTTRIDQRTSGRGCSVCAGKTVQVGVNDLASQNPELAVEWDYERNGELKPEDVTPGSKNKVYWKCKHGHVWEAYVYSRTLRNTPAGCKQCHLLPKPGESLKDLYPDLTKEYSGDNVYKAEELKPGSNINAEWECGTCGYKWKARVSSRTKKNNPAGCKQCYLLPKPGKSLKDLYPELTEEYNDTRYNS